MATRRRKKKKVFITALHRSYGHLAISLIMIVSFYNFLSENEMLVYRDNAHIGETQKWKKGDFHGFKVHGTNIPCQLNACCAADSLYIHYIGITRPSLGAALHMGERTSYSLRALSALRENLRISLFSARAALNFLTRALEILIEYSLTFVIFFQTRSYSKYLMLGQEKWYGSELWLLKMYKLKSADFSGKKRCESWINLRTRGAVGSAEPTSAGQGQLFQKYQRCSGYNSEWRLHRGGKRMSALYVTEVASRRASAVMCAVEIGTIHVFC